MHLRVAPQGVTPNPALLRLRGIDWLLVVAYAVSAFDLLRQPIWVSAGWPKLPVIRGG